MEEQEVLLIEGLLPVSILYLLLNFYFFGERVLILLAWMKNCKHVNTILGVTETINSKLL
jgi:hypothetical protein